MPKRREVALSKKNPSNQLVTNEETTSPPPYSTENGIDNPAYNPEGKIAKENM